MSDHPVDLCIEQTISLSLELHIERGPTTGQDATDVQQVSVIPLGLMSVTSYFGIEIRDSI